MCGGRGTALSHAAIRKVLRCVRCYKDPAYKSLSTLRSLPATPRCRATLRATLAASSGVDGKLRP
jgi:hypothetical protein